MRLNQEPKWHHYQIRKVIKFQDQDQKWTKIDKKVKRTGKRDYNQKGK